MLSPLKRNEKQNEPLKWERASSIRNAEEANANAIDGDARYY